MKEAHLEKLLADPSAVPEGELEYFAAALYEKLYDGMVRNGYTQDTVGDLTSGVIEISICRMGVEVASDVGVSLRAAAEHIDTMVGSLSGRENLTMFFRQMKTRRDLQSTLTLGEVVDDPSTNSGPNGKDKK